MSNLRWFQKPNGQKVLQFKRDEDWIDVPIVQDDKLAALENIEEEIIARACRGGVCED
jgi:hypothetical protein